MDEAIDCDRRLIRWVASGPLGDKVRGLPVHKWSGAKCGPEQFRPRKGPLRVHLTLCVSFAPRAGLEPATQRLTASERAVASAKTPVHRLAILFDIHCISLGIP